MPRKPRFILPGVPQHVIQRGNNREPCFFSKADYYRYLEYLENAAKKYQCQIHAYVLMTNHVHLLVTPLMEYGIGRMMQAVGRSYVQYINHTYQRTGTLWEGRYKASLIDSERYLLACMRYIELNPVRAGMVEHPGDYSWSSYGVNGYDEGSTLITPHSLYNDLGRDNDIRCNAYRELFRHQIETETLHEIREAINHEVVLGRSYFKDKIEKVTRRQTRLGQPGRPRLKKDDCIY